MKSITKKRNLIKVVNKLKDNRYLTSKELDLLVDQSFSPKYLGSGMHGDYYKTLFNSNIRYWRLFWVEEVHNGVKQHNGQPCEVLRDDEEDGELIESYERYKNEEV